VDWRVRRRNQTLIPRISTVYRMVVDGAEHLDMKPVTIQPMIAAGRLTGYVDWEQLVPKLIPMRPRH
jgi:hypothetical protein